MRSTFIFLVLLAISTSTFAQKKDSSDNAQDKNKKDASENKVQPGVVDGKDSRQPQETRYQEGSTGVKRSIHYKFSSNKTDSDPGNGVFRYNGSSLPSTTYVFLDDIDLSGEDQTKWYSTWDDTTGATGRGRINIVEYEGQNIDVFDVTGVFVKGDGY